MRRFLVILLLLAGCSKGPEADLQYIGQVRSAAAEWALVNEQSSRGQLTEVYVRSMRQAIRQQIASAQSALTVPGSSYAQEMEALAKEPDDASADALRAHSDKLKQIEDHLESA